MQSGTLNEIYRRPTMFLRKPSAEETLQAAIERNRGGEHKMKRGVGHRSPGRKPTEEPGQLQTRASFHEKGRATRREGTRAYKVELRVTEN